MFGKKKEETPKVEERAMPQPVKPGSTEGIGVEVGDQNDPNRIVVMKQYYIGTPEKDFRFKVDESLTSVVYSEDSGYIDEYVKGSVKPSNYWEKKILGHKPKDISVLSFSEMPFTIVTGITFRVPGGDIDGTLRGSFKFHRGNPESIAALMQSSYVQEKAIYNVRKKYITAEGLEKLMRTAFADAIRTPLFKEKIYQDLDQLHEDIRQKINDTPFFFERSIEVSEISVRPDRTMVENLDDEEVKHKILMRMQEMEAEHRAQAISIAKSDQDNFKDI